MICRPILLFSPITGPPVALRCVDADLAVGQCEVSPSCDATSHWEYNERWRVMGIQPTLAWFNPQFLSINIYIYINISYPFLEAQSTILSYSIPVDWITFVVVGISPTWISWRPTSVAASSLTPAWRTYNAEPNAFMLSSCGDVPRYVCWFIINVSKAIINHLDVDGLYSPKQ